MITLADSVIYFRQHCELTEGNVLGSRKVTLTIGYWKIIQENGTAVILEEVHTKTRKSVTHGMLGKLLASRAQTIGFVSMGQVPKLVTLEG